MGLAADLRYDLPRPNAAQRLMQSLASSRPGAWFFSRIATRADRAVSDLTDDRVSLPLLVAGVPALDLITTGRRSGSPRRTRLTAVPLDGTLALLGTNFAMPRTPGWVLNLEADPRAEVAHRGITRKVLARPATETERERVLACSAAVYVGYPRYRERITGRMLRIFVLEPAQSD